jgi:HEAT repeat protein
MNLTELLYSPILVLTLGLTACAVSSQPKLMATRSDLAPAQSSTSVQNFTAIEGANLATKLDGARQRAGNGQRAYWSAYAFDVRPGVAVDPGIREFRGSMNTLGDTSVFVGTTASGMTVETRNLAVFLLREPGNNQVTRMEIYNLDRKREFGGYPVYWLGRATNEESLSYLQNLSNASPENLLGERVVLGIALHDDARVANQLKNFVRTSQNQRIRSASVYWLGQVGGETAFLGDLVRNESENKKVRRQAAFSIGESRDPGSFAVLQTLYDAVKDLEVKRSIISATGSSHQEGAAYAFLLKVARNDAERDSRRTAIRRLGEFERPELVEDLMKIYASDAEVEVKRAVLHALSETKSAGAQTQLLSLARSEPNQELRKGAIRVLAERGEAVVSELIGVYDSEKIPEVKRSLLQALAEIKSAKVEDKLFAVARADENLDLRRQAIRLLGERADKRSFDFLSATALSPDGNTEVQMQAVRAISERKADEAVPLLIKIARSHGNQLVRKQAIRALGESGDPRALEFFREVLTKE